MARPATVDITPFKAPSRVEYSAAMLSVLGKPHAAPMPTRMADVTARAWAAWAVGKQEGSLQRSVGLRQLLYAVQGIQRRYYSMAMSFVIVGCKWLQARHVPRQARMALARQAPKQASKQAFKLTNTTQRNMDCTVMCAAHITRQYTRQHTHDNTSHGVAYLWLPCLDTAERMQTPESLLAWTKGECVMGAGTPPGAPAAEVACLIASCPGM